MLAVIMAVVSTILGSLGLWLLYRKTTKDMLSTYQTWTESKSSIERKLNEIIT